MEKKKYTPEQMADAGWLLDVIESVPKEKQPLMTVIADVFISGMRAQERLTAANGQPTT